MLSMSRWTRFHSSDSGLKAAAGAVRAMRSPISSTVVAATRDCVVGAGVRTGVGAEWRTAVQHSSTANAAIADAGSQRRTLGLGCSAAARTARMIELWNDELTASLGGDCRKASSSACRSCPKRPNSSERFIFVRNDSGSVLRASSAAEILNFVNHEFIGVIRDS